MVDRCKRSRHRQNPDVEAWHAPAFDCEEVYRFITFTNGASVTGSSEKCVTSYSLGEPAASLFDVFQLRETSPIRASELQYRRLGYPEAMIQKHSDELKEFEAKYLARQK